MATQTLREELLDLLTAGSSRPRPSPCHGYANLCTCARCEARGQQNRLILYADRRGLHIDRPAAIRLLMRYGPRKAKPVIDAMIEAAKRKAA